MFPGDEKHVQVKIRHARLRTQKCGKACVVTSDTHEELRKKRVGWRNCIECDDEGPVKNPALASQRMGHA